MDNLTVSLLLQWNLQIISVLPSVNAFRLLSTCYKTQRKVELYFELCFKDILGMPNYTSSSCRHDCAQDTTRLRAGHDTIARRTRHDCAEDTTRIARRTRHDCAQDTTRLRAGHDTIARRTRHDCAQDTTRLRAGHDTIARRTRHDCAQDTTRLRGGPDCVET